MFSFEQILAETMFIGAGFYSVAKSKLPYEIRTVQRERNNDNG